MAKIKTRSAVKKRFSSTGGKRSVKIKRNRAFRRHLLTGKTPKQKQQLRSKCYVSKADQKRIALMIPYK